MYIPACKKEAKTMADKCESRKTKNPREKNISPRRHWQPLQRLLLSVILLFQAYTHAPPLLYAGKETTFLANSTPQTSLDPMSGKTVLQGHLSGISGHKLQDGRCTHTKQITSALGGH